MGNRVLDTLADVIGGGGRIKFPRQHNAPYGLPQSVMTLASVCRSGQAATEAVVTGSGDGGNLPAARWFRWKVRAAGLDGTREICDDTMETAVRAAKKGGIRRNGPVMIAIGRHEMPRHGKDSMKYPVRSRFKNGTGRFGAYATMQVAGSPVNATLGCIPLTGGLMPVSCASSRIFSGNRTQGTAFFCRIGSSTWPA